MVAGLIRPDDGRIVVDGVTWFDAGARIHRSPRERGIGYLFQDYALFPHWTVGDNVAAAFSAGWPRPRSEAQGRVVDELLDRFGLRDVERAYPAQLSGGQRQRVALARALATEPKLLLLDEPFGALDAKVRVELRRWLRELHDSTGLTTVFVTHDQEEALALADRVAIMARGRIEQVGTPTEVYEDPRTAFVYDFLGRTNAFDCVVEGGRARIGDKGCPVDGLPEGPAVAFVRPHDVLLRGPDNNEPSADATLPGTGSVRVVTVLGPKAWVEVAHGPQIIAAEIGRDTMKELRLAPGSQCSVQLRLPCFFSRSTAAHDLTRR